MTTQSWYSAPPESPEPEDERPLGELFAALTRSLQTLIQKELELAKVEIREQTSRATKAGAMLGAGAVGGFVALLLLAFAAAWGLAEVVATGLAFLASVAFLIGAILSDTRNSLYAVGVLVLSIPLYLLVRRK